MKVGYTFSPPLRMEPGSYSEAELLQMAKDQGCVATRVDETVKREPKYDFVHQPCDEGARNKYPQRIIQVYHPNADSERMRVLIGGNTVAELTRNEALVLIFELAATMRG